MWITGLNLGTCQKRNYLSKIGKHWRGKYFHVVFEGLIIKIARTLKFKLIMLCLYILIAYLIQILLRLTRRFISHLRHTATVFCSNQHADCPKPVALFRQPTDRPTLMLSRTQPASCIVAKSVQKRAPPNCTQIRKSPVCLPSPPCADHHRVCTERLHAINGFSVCSEFRVAMRRRLRTGQ
jgi:hypothetical protein